MPSLVPSKGSTFIAIFVRFARQQRVFPLQASALQVLPLFGHHEVSQNSIRFHHKDHERCIYSCYCSVCYWSGSLGKEFSGGGIADASIFVSTSWASHPLIILFYPRWLQILPKSYEKSCLTSMWKKSRKILTVLDILHTAVSRWIALPIIVGHGKITLASHWFFTTNFQDSRLSLVWAFMSAVLYLSFAGLSGGRSSEQKVEQEWFYSLPYIKVQM